MKETHKKMFEKAMFTTMTVCKTQNAAGVLDRNVSYLSDVCRPWVLFAVFFI